MEWHEIKNWLVMITNLDRDALHIYGAILIQLMFAWIFRRSIASPLPWLAVLFFALVNEYFDFKFAGNDPRNRQIFIAEAYRDMWNTMLMPTIFMAVANFWPQRLVSLSLKQEKQGSKDGETPEN